MKAKTKKEQRDDTTVPEDHVKVKMSICGNCNGFVRVYVEHMIGIIGKNEFMKEVLKHNLSVKEITLTEYRKNNPEMCSCK
jgi:hypothetical protein